MEELLEDSIMVKLLLTTREGIMKIYGRLVDMVARRVAILRQEQEGGHRVLVPVAPNSINRRRRTSISN
jgi:hypothetical protein